MLHVSFMLLTTVPKATTIIGTTTNRVNDHNFLTSKANLSNLSAFFFLHLSILHPQLCMLYLSSCIVFIFTIKWHYNWLPILCFTTKLNHKTRLHICINVFDDAFSIMFSAKSIFVATFPTDNSFYIAMTTLIFLMG